MGHVTTQLGWSWSAVFGPDRFVFVTSGKVVVVAHLGHAPAIHRSIWSGLLYLLCHAAGHVCIPELLCFYFFSEVARAGVRFKFPLYPDHVVVGQPHYALIGRALAPHH